MNKTAYYKQKYDELMLKAKKREQDPFSNKLGYTERHHIIPKCIGGDDNPNNKVYLTHNEHIKAHVLLCKMLPNNKALAKALRAVELDSPARQMAEREKFIALCLEVMEGGNNGTI